LSFFESDVVDGDKSPGKFNIRRDNYIRFRVRIAVRLASAEHVLRSIAKLLRLRVRLRDVLMLDILRRLSDEAVVGGFKRWP